MARPWTTIDRVATPEGALELRQRGARDFLITVGGRVLMTSAAHRSEEALAELACAAIAGVQAPRVLVGGLGMGYTLAAALAALPRAATVEVVEKNPQVIAWCCGPLAPLTDGALDDARVKVTVGDVAGVIAAAVPGGLDAILLDLYEGPHAASQPRDDPFYGPAALSRARAALRRGGVFAVWSEAADRRFEECLVTVGLRGTRHLRGRGGRTHVVYCAVRSDGVPGRVP